MKHATARRFTWLDQIRVRQCVGASVLPCGCCTGRYLGYSEQLVEVIDLRGAQCSDPAHTVGSIIERGPRPSWMEHASA
jgi:hypothetical protein